MDPTAYLQCLSILMGNVFTRMGDGTRLGEQPFLVVDYFGLVRCVHSPAVCVCVRSDVPLLQMETLLEYLPEVSFQATIMDTAIRLSLAGLHIQHAEANSALLHFLLVRPLPTPSTPRACVTVFAAETVAWAGG